MSPSHRPAHIVSALLGFAAVAMAACAQPLSQPSPPTSSTDADPPPSSPSAPGTPATTEPPASWSGLIAIAGVSELPAPDVTPLNGYPGSNLYLGSFTSAQSWQAFAASQPRPLDGFDSIDWSTEMVAYAVIDARTNKLSFAAWDAGAGGAATLTIHWSTIEPFYGEFTPGVFARVPRAGITSFDVRTEDRPLGTVQVR